MRASIEQSENAGHPTGSILPRVVPRDPEPLGGGDEGRTRRETVEAAVVDQDGPKNSLQKISAIARGFCQMMVFIGLHSGVEPKYVTKITVR
ncbi:hypothetical protein [Acuticoccus sp. I52.16.1]|uniref:hypothetical protein n=1 Tax=Acuticoccus sp. I52.16.1 TaxID=2928472 RepID=UPI001FD60226|nr:hypothetical protein [Acuticoccus sp. I52.16.1]UOM32914.1 hypothetical protein MRB58_13625 [Acuticoccus sp. I52.16.1]